MTYFIAFLDDRAFRAFVRLRWTAFLLNLTLPHTLYVILR